MKINKVTLLSKDNYFTRSEGEYTNYSYELILENDLKIIIKDLKSPLPDWTKNSTIEYGLKSQLDNEVKSFIIKNQYDTLKGVL